MSLYNLFKELPQFVIRPTAKTIECDCDCGPGNGDVISHSKCRYCKQVWCPTTLKRDWCPNPDCEHGIRGYNFQPYDEHNKWIKCSSCAMWFKNSVLAVHNCYIKANPAIEDDGLPGIGGEGSGPIVVVEQSPSNEPEPEIISSPIQEQAPSDIQEPEEEEETESEYYWRTHPVRRRQG